MVTEKEFNIVKALVEEEIGSLMDGDCFDSTVMTEYLFSLSEIVEKLKEDVDARRDFSRERALQ